MRRTVVLIILGLLLGISALALIIPRIDLYAKLEFRFEDSVSRKWVWDSTVRLQDRSIRAFYQSDSGPIPFVFSHLKPGPSNLEISAPGYLPVSIPLKLHRGLNRLENPIEMQGYEIPDLQRFYVFERLQAGDLVCELRPVDAGGHAVTNHPCLPVWVGCRISVELKDGRPAAEPSSSGVTRGHELFLGDVAWEWDPSPEALFRYTARIQENRIASDPAPYRVIDYLIIIPDTRWMSAQDLERVVRNAPSLSDVAALSAYLDAQAPKLRYFLDTSSNVKAREG